VRRKYEQVARFSARDGNGASFARVYDCMGLCSVCSLPFDALTERQYVASLPRRSFLAGGLKMQGVSQVLKFTVIVERGWSFV
jgi:hypothetical protein